MEYIGLNDCQILNSDITDGFRITLDNNSIVHLRPSGNAPELRCYAEADTQDAAYKLVETVLANIEKQVG
jgi:phosphomannomutase